MEAYRIDRFGSVDGIVLRSSEDPRPGLREILMRVRATSLNYRDLMVLKGGGRGPTKLGAVPLSDGAGEVAAIGDGVTPVTVGDRIAGCFHPRWFGGPISADYLTDRPARGQSRRDVGGIRRVERGGDRASAKPPLL
jgi:NADPH:quinone reductase-like Zn-dependent oxidoreductase